jgi:hypothetical protein
MIKNLKKGIDNSDKVEYYQTLQDEIEQYLRLKSVVNKVLDSCKPYYTDVHSTLKNMWEKEQRIIALRGSIYNNLG